MGECNTKKIIAKLCRIISSAIILLIATGAMVSISPPEVQATDFTFGYTTIGTTGWRDIYDRPEGYIATSGGSGGTGVSITAYIVSNSGSESRKAKCALYDNADPSNLIAITEELDIAPVTPAWYTFNFTSSPSISASTTYRIVSWSEGAYQYYNTDSGHTVKELSSLSYGSWPSTITWDTTIGDRSNSIYVTYTANAAPTISNVQAINIMDTSATITWDTDLLSNSTVWYGLTTAYGSNVTSSTNVTSHSLNLSSLDDDTLYHYKVNSANAYGSTNSTDYNFSTTITDVTPPVISSVNVSSIGGTTATVGWITDDSANSTVWYGLSSSYTWSSVNSSYSTTHNIYLTGLNASTTYHYSVNSSNLFGLSSNTSDDTFVTSEVPPASVTIVTSINLVSTIECIGVSANYTGDNNNNNSAVLEYKKTADSGWITAFEMYKDTSTLSYRGSIFWLSENTAYDVRVTFSDIDGVSGTNPISTSTTTWNSNPPSTGTPYYVSASGSDSADGSFATPWKTVQHAADTVTVGDNVNIISNTLGEKVSISVSGTANNYITFQSYTTPKTVISGSFSVTNVFAITGNYIRIRNLYCCNTTHNTIDITSNAIGVIVENCDIVGANSGGGGTTGAIGISYGASKCLIQSNNITVNIGNTNTTNGIVYWKPGGNHVFRYNTIVGTGGYLRDGIGGGEEDQPETVNDCDFYGNTVTGAQDDGIQPDGGNRNTRIWGNTVRDSFVGISTCPVLVGPCYIFRNIVDNYSYGAWKCGDSYSTGRIYLFHNTFWTNSGGCSILNQTNDGFDNLVSRNNILRGTRYVFELNDASAASVVDYDCMYTTDGTRFAKWNGGTYTFADFKSMIGQELHGIQSEPGLTDAGGDNFTLLSSSVCVDNGTALLQFNNATSPWPFKGSEPDMGAYEYDSGENQPPVLGPIGSQYGRETHILQFSVNATDPEGDNMAYTANNLPSGSSFDNVTKTFTWTPTLGQAGVYSNVQFVVTDNNSNTDSEYVTITISSDAPPVLAAIGNKSVAYDHLLQFVVTATDGDGDTITYTSNNTPSGSNFDNSTRTFTWVPNSGQVGVYSPVRFSANTSDGQSDFEDISITVTASQPPVLAPIGNKSIEVEHLLQFIVSASDPEEDLITYTVTNIPSGSVFDNTTRTFTWTPALGDIGIYTPVRFSANTSDGQSDYEDINITVADTDPPVLNSVGNKSVVELHLLQFTISGTSPDGYPLVYSANTTPLGSSFNGTTHLFSWTPTHEQVGVYNGVRFIVTDNHSNLDYEDISITATANEPPVLATIGNKSVAFDRLLQFAVSATDPESDPITYTANNIPSGSIFDNITRIFTWTPNSGQIGVHTPIRFSANTSDTQSDYEDISITVTNTDSPAPNQIDNNPGFNLLNAVVVISYISLVLFTMVALGRKSTVAALLWMAVAIYIGEAFIAIIQEALNSVF